jgi:hypothetical protein
MRETKNRTVDNSEGKTTVTWSRYTKLERVNATREKKKKKKRKKNVDDDRHVYEKSQEDGTSTSIRERKQESQICSQTQYSSLFFFRLLSNFSLNNSTYKRPRKATIERRAYAYKRKH